LSPYLKIIRLPNLAIIVLTQYLLRICIIGTFYDFSAARFALSEFHFFLLVLSTVFIAAGGYIINDIKDEKTDLLNKPEKVIIDKKITSRMAMRLYYGLTILGILVGFYLGFIVKYFLLGFVFVAVALLLWFYSSRYQKTLLLGNIFISLLSALVVFIVWLFELFALRADPIIYTEAMKQISIITIVVLGYSVFAFLVSLIREIFKDIEDIEGDRKEGYKTLPIVFGRNKTNWIAVGFMIITVLLLAIAQFYLYQKGIMLVFWYLMVAVQLLLFFVLYNAIKAKSKEDFRFLSNACKIIMVAGILSMELFYISF